MIQRTDKELANIVRDAYQWIDAEVKHETKTKADIVELVECMQEIVQEHLNEKQSDHFYSYLKRLLDGRRSSSK